MFTTLLKKAKARRFEGLFAVVGVLFSSSALAAIPVNIFWQPVPKTASYTIEIFKDAAFTHKIHETTSKTNNLDWQSPGEGVYHWRVKAQFNAAVAQGSFVAVDRDPSGSQYRVDWSAVGKASQYQVRLNEWGRTVKVLKTSDHSSILRRGDVATKVEIFPDGARVHAGIAYNAGLAFDPRPKMDRVRETEFVRGRTPEESALVNYFSRLSFGLTLQQEDLVAESSKSRFKAKGVSPGLSLGLVVKPTDYLYAGARFSSLKSKYAGDVTNRAGGAVTGEASVDESRYQLDVAAGFDLVGLFADASRHSLVLGASGRYIEVPALPIDRAVTQNSPVNVKQAGFSLPGLFAGYGVVLGSYGVHVTADWLKAPKETDLKQESRSLSLGVDYRWTENTTLMISGFGQETRYERCYVAAEPCDPTNAKLNQVGLNAGLGIVFR